MVKKLKSIISSILNRRTACEAFSLSDLHGFFIFLVYSYFLFNALEVYALSLLIYAVQNSSA